MRRLWISLALAGAAACSSPSGERDEAPAPAAVVPIPELPGPPAFPPEVRSLKLVRSITVRLEPKEDSKKLGTVAAHTRVAWKRIERGPGCSERWIEIEPRGWVCEVYMEPSEKPPRGVELPKLARGDVVPGIYGKVVTEGAQIYRLEEGELVPERELVGHATVRRYGERRIGDRAFWNIGGGEFLPASDIRLHRPTTWRGTRLGDETGLELPVGFALRAGAPRRPVKVLSAPEGGELKRTLEPREVVVVLETRRGEGGDPAAYRIGEEAWVRAADLRVAEEREPPPATRQRERWIDIDLNRQLLVAYEGERPVYATLVSSGTRKTPTDTGIFRVWIKFSETDMTGEMGGAPSYSVATVPWTQYFAPDLALHTAYWHDGFGAPRSHGCVNLAPIDARFLYFWSEPNLPRGWSMAHGIEERPGSMVRVRSAADPDPDFKGYARRVHEARLGEG